MAEVKPKLAITRSVSAERKLLRTTSSTSGWTLALSTNQAARSLQKLSTLCFAGIRKRLSATCTCLTFQPAVQLKTTSFPGDGNQHSRKADGLLVAGHSKSSLLRHQLNSSLKRKIGLVISNH